MVAARFRRWRDATDRHRSDGAIRSAGSTVRRFPLIPGVVMDWVEDLIRLLRQ